MKRIFPIGLIALGILLVFGALGSQFYNDIFTDLAAVSLPNQMAGLPLTNRVTGPQAAAAFENLHGKQFPLTSGAIGYYGNQQATLWVAGAPLNFMASRMIEAMRAKIAEGNSPFTPMTEIKDGVRTVYVLEGMGQKHFYFQSENLIVWLAADPSIADEALEQILEVYP